MLPSPEKEKIELQHLIDNCLQIMSPIFKKENVMLNNTMLQNFKVNIDQHQMEQVLINLLTNAVVALENLEQKQIFISAEANENRVFIKISEKLLVF